MPENTPQTLTVMEAGFKLGRGHDDEFWNMNIKTIGIAAQEPGFVSVVGGPIADSSWLYFGVTFDTPQAMDAWHHHEKHLPVQRLAKTRWFSAYYIRKWRLPTEGEDLGDWILCQTEIAPGSPLSEQATASFLALVGSTLRDLDAPPFETLSGEYDPQPYQFAGPLEAAPQTISGHYLLLTHWTSSAALDKWLNSPVYEACEGLGEVTTSVFVPIREESGSRFALRDDGLQRDWVFSENSSDTGQS
jgi:heme-degrading monooxygenase HmoA